MAFPTWTEGLRIVVNESIVWSHKPDSSDPSDVSLWEWRRDRRLTFEAEISTSGRYESDFVDYRDSPSIINPVFRYYNSASDENRRIIYKGTWLIDDINITNSKNKKIVISVTLVNSSDPENEWAVRV